MLRRVHFLHLASWARARRPKSSEGSQTMSRQRDTGRRWPFAGRRDERNAPETVGLLDSDLAHGCLHGSHPSRNRTEHHGRRPAGQDLPRRPRARDGCARPGPTAGGPRRRGFRRRPRTNPNPTAQTCGGLRQRGARCRGSGDRAHDDERHRSTGARARGRQSDLRSAPGKPERAPPRAAPTSAPAASPPLLALGTPTSGHEVFGYAPYWSLAQGSQFPVGDFSTIAYFGVDVNPDGTIRTSGPGGAATRARISPTW